MSDDGRYDQFADVRNDWQGTFAGDALGDFDGVRSTPTPNGMVFEMQCEFCGIPQQVTVAWSAIICMKYGFSPNIVGDAYPGQLAMLHDEKWTIDGEGNWGPVDIGCGKCGTRMGGPSRLRIRPHELEQFLASARGRRMIRPDGESKLSQMCAALAARARQR